MQLSIVKVNTLTKKDAIDYAKQAADKNQRNFIILYRGISPWLADKELSI